MDALKYISTKSEFNLIMNSLEPSANCEKVNLQLNFVIPELPHLIRKINYKINQQNTETKNLFAYILCLKYIK